MTRTRPFCRLPRLIRDDRGAMLIEMAIVTPVLALLALGAFETSRMITRQQELQSGALEGEQIALAASAGATTNVDTVKTILMNSLDLEASQVAVVKRFRCDSTAALVDLPSDCTAGAVVSSYMELTVTDTYTPIWTQLGFGGPFNYRVVRRVQLS